MNLRARCGLALVLFLAISGWGAPLGAAPTGPDDDGPEDLFEEAWRMVRRHFYDPTFSGLDWNEVGDRYRPLAREAAGPRQLHAVINRMLAELGTSHTVLIEEEVYRDHVGAEFDDRRVRLVGLDLVRFEEGYFVHSILEGGAAEKAGILRGDRLVSINGVAPEDSVRLLPGGGDPGLAGPPLFVISAERAKQIELGIQRIRGASPATVIDVIPEKTNQIEAIQRSVRVEEVDDLRVGVIHFRHFMSRRVVLIFDQALRGPLRGVDALVVDLRGRGGSARVADRVLRRLHTFEGPVVAVIDGNSRSAKEVVAHNIREGGVGTLVGERTQGAVLAGSFFPLSDGSVMLLPTDRVDRLTGGVNLEGRGVPPDVWIEDRLAYAGGEDRLLERALEVVAAKARGVTSLSRRWY